MSQPSETAPHGYLSQYFFALFDPEILTYDLFDLILIGGRGIVMDYPCAKFGNFSFSTGSFDFIMQTSRQTDRQTESQRQINAILM